MADEKKPKKPKVVPGEPIKFKEYTIKQKRSGRYEVLNAKGKNVNGADKLKLLIDAKVLKESVKKAPEEKAAE